MHPVIRSEHLVLRPACMDDLETTHAYAGNLENTHLMMFLPFESMEETARSLREAEEEWGKEEPARREFSVLLGGAHIGGITLYTLDEPGNAELGWVLHRAYWGRGYVTEAARAVLGYAKEQLNVKRVIACCDSENIASRRVMEKLGMRMIVSDGTRKNRSSDEERVELIYELRL